MGSFNNQNIKNLGIGHVATDEMIDAEGELIFHVGEEWITMMDKDGANQYAGIGNTTSAGITDWNISASTINYDNIIDIDELINKNNTTTLKDKEGDEVVGIVSENDDHELIINLGGKKVNLGKVGQLDLGALSKAMVKRKLNNG